MNEFLKKNLNSYERLLEKHNYANERLVEMWEKTIEKKSYLNAIYGLNAENNFRLFFDVGRIESEADFMNCYTDIHTAVRQILKTSCEDISSFSVYDNKISYIKEGKKIDMKLSKFISKLIRNMIDGTVMVTVIKSLVLMVNMEMSHDTDINNVVSDLFSLKKAVTGFISTNPFDFLVNSNLDWSNCFRINSSYEQYKSSGLYLAMDEVSFISGLVSSKDMEKDMEKKFVSRFWCYHTDLKHQLAFNKVYGAVNNKHKKEIREKIEDLYAAKAGIESLWKVQKSVELSYQSTSEALYFDNGDLDLATLKSVFDENIRPDINFSSVGFCLKSGDLHEELTRGACSSICSVCGAYVDDENSNELDGELYCEHCFDEDFGYCEDCEEYHSRDYMTYVGSGDRYVCDSCLDSNYTRCDECDRYEHDDDITKDKAGNNYCINCRDDKLFYCEHCEEYDVIDDSVYVDSEDIYVCNSCFSDDFSECEHCGKVHNNDDIINDDDFGDVCRDCFDDLSESRNEKLEIEENKKLQTEFNFSVTCEKCNTDTTSCKVYLSPKHGTICESCFNLIIKKVV